MNRVARITQSIVRRNLHASPLLQFERIDKDKMKDSIRKSDVFVFDVRDQNEVDGGHIMASNFNHIPLEEIDEALALSDSNYELIYEFKKPKAHDKVVFYCMAGI